MFLTDTKLKALKPRKSSYRVFDRSGDSRVLDESSAKTRGFGVQVTPSRGKTFFLQYRFNGRRKFLTLGRYGEITLSEARERARQARRLLAKNIDPREHASEQARISEAERAEAERQRRERETRKTRTVAKMINVYVNKMREDGKTSWKEVQRCLTLDAIPYIGERPANEVTPDEIGRLIARVINRGAKIQGNRLHAYLSAAFNAGISHDSSPRALANGIKFNISDNPVEKVSRDANVESTRTRTLANEELKNLWTYSGNGISPINLLMLKLIIAMGGTRPGEVTQAKIKEIDLENRLWTWPAKRIKNRRVHILPITDLAATLIEEALQYTVDGNPYLFPNRVAHARPVNIASLGHAVERFSKRSGFKRFQPKDLRRTVKTRMGEAGILKIVRDVVQNHARTDVSSKHYDLWEYLPEKREALEKWADYLERVIASPNVIPIRKNTAPSTPRLSG